MKREDKRKAGVAIFSFVMVLSFFGAGISSTGCLFPWQTMDNLVVASTISVDDKGNFNVDGAVTSSSVKALGFVSSAEALANSYDVARDIADSSGVDASWYDTLRYDGTNRRIVDYERVSGEYTDYYGKENWYSFYGDNADTEIRSMQTIEYATAVASVSGLNVKDINLDNLGLNPLGQMTTSLTLDPYLSRTFDGTGSVVDGFGDLSSFTNTFGMQQFVWKMDDVVGYGYGSNGALMYALPVEGFDYTQVEGYDGAQGTPGALNVVVDINGVNVETMGGSTLKWNETKLGVSGGGWDSVWLGKPFVFSTIYFKVQTNGEINYYVYVLTDALRNMKNIDDLLTVTVDACMVGVKVDTWSDVSADVTQKLASDDCDFSKKLETAMDELKANSAYYIHNFTSSISSFTSGIMSEISASLGNVNTPFGLNYLTSGMADAAVDAMNDAVDSVISFQKAVELSQAVSTVYAMKSVHPDAASACSLMDGGNVKFGWTSWGLSFTKSWAKQIADNYQYCTIGRTTTAASLTQSHEAAIYTDSHQNHDYDPYSVAGFPKLASAQSSLNVKYDAGSANDIKENGIDKFLAWEDTVLRWLNDVINSYQPSLPTYTLADIDMNMFLEGALIKYFHGNSTHIKVANVWNGGLSFYIPTIDDIIANFTGAYSDLFDITSDPVFMDLMNNYTALSWDYGNLTDSVGRLESFIMTQNGTILGLKENVTILEGYIVELKGEIIGYVEYIQELNGTITTLEGQVVDLTNSMNEMAIQFALQYSDLYSQYNLSLGTIKGLENNISGLEDIIWRQGMDIERLNVNIENMQIVMDKLAMDLKNETALRMFYEDQYNLTTGMLSDLRDTLADFGFQTGYSAGAGMWLVSCDLSEFESHFNLIQGASIAPPTYVFKDNLIAGEFYIPFKLDVSNINMLNDTIVDVYATKAGSEDVDELLGTFQCSYASGNTYNIPFTAYTSGTYDMYAVVTFTNGTPSALDDVVYRTTPDYGFGKGISFVDKSLENMMLVSDGYNPMFFDVNTTNVVIKLEIYDVDDKMYLPPVSFIGGNTRSATVSISSSTSVKWSVNYIREHTYVGTIKIYDMTGKLVEEIEIPEFTLKNAAYAESERRSDTLAISDFEEDSEFVAFGKWSE